MYEIIEMKKRRIGYPLQPAITNYHSFSYLLSSFIYLLFSCILFLMPKRATKIVINRHNNKIHTKKKNKNKPAAVRT